MRLPKQYAITLDRLLLKAVQRPDKINGIILPDQSKAPQWFEVVAVGPGRLTDYGTLVPAPAKVGQSVMLDNKDAGIEVKLEDEAYRLVLPINIIVVKGKQ